jgi:hypothetical protein
LLKREAPAQQARASDYGNQDGFRHAAQFGAVFVGKRNISEWIFKI